MPYYVKTCHLQKYTVKYASIAVHCVTLPHWYGNLAKFGHAVLEIYEWSDIHMIQIDRYRYGTDIDTIIIILQTSPGTK